MAVGAACLAFCLPFAIAAAQATRELHVCHAGSLTAAFTDLEQAFARESRSVHITDTSGGSVDLARRFATGALECDVFAPADYLIIERMLTPARLSDFTIRFAHGRMVLAYVGDDPKAAALTVTPPWDDRAGHLVPAVTGRWYEALIAPGVRIAGAHPFLDPGGYRAHMIFALAEAHYSVPGLNNSLLQHYQVNPASAPAAVLGKDFNFQFTYEHSAAAAAATNAAYRYATLPAEIDLSGDRVLNAAGDITIPGLGGKEHAASVSIPARAVEWGVTIPVRARNRADAVRFVAALLGPSGRDALMRHGPHPLTPARVSAEDHRRVPISLVALTSIDRARR